MPRWMHTTYASSMRTSGDLEPTMTKYNRMIKIARYKLINDLCDALKPSVYKGNAPAYKIYIHIFPHETAS